MQIGLNLPVVQQVPSRTSAWERNGGVEAIVEVATAADRLGFAWVSCSDHVAVPQSQVGAMGETWYEPIATLSYVAALTSRIRLLSHVMVLPYRHPLLMAKSFATLDRLSGGRVVIGVGAGHLKPEFRSLGLAYEHRGRQADEALAGLATALVDERSSHAGEFASWRDMLVAPRAIQQPRPQIWVGGNGRNAVRRALTHADGWIPWEIGLDEFREQVAAIRRRMDRVGFQIIAPAGFGAGESASDLRARLDAWTAVGATGCHLGIEHRSLAELLDRLAVVAELVA